MTRFLTTAVVAVSLADAALLPTAYAQQPLKIGAINPFSGPTAQYGAEVTRGFEMAAEKANASGGVLGRKVEIVHGDAANPQQGIQAVEQLMNKEKVDLFAGTYTSGISNTASDAAMRFNKLYLETQRQKRLLEAFGVKIVGVGAHSARTIDMNDTVLRIKAANPDVLIETGYVADGNLLLKTMRDQGFKPAATVFLGTGDTPETVAALGAAGVEGLLVIAYPRFDVAEYFAPGVKAYRDAYRAKYKVDPIQTQSLTSYVGMQILFEAITAAGSIEPEKVRAAAAKMDKPIGSYINGYGVKFDKDFQNQRAVTTTVQWQAGKVVTVFPKNAVSPGVKLVSLARP